MDVKYRWPFYFLLENIDDFCRNIFKRGERMNKLFRRTSIDDAPISNPASSDVVFIAGGLKAAKNCPEIHRQKVLHDVSQVLQCTPQDLNFLFDAQGDEPDNSIYDFPDSERRRQVLRHNGLLAAE